MSASATERPLLSALAAEAQEPTMEVTPEEKDMQQQQQTNEQTTTTTAAKRKKQPKLLALELDVKNYVNGVFVERPTALYASDEWRVHYTLAEMRSPERARALYDACKARRREDLVREASDVGLRMYLKMLSKLCAGSRLWRKKQDLLDARTGQVVYAGSAIPDHQREEVE
jgi:hypothetical protein